MPGPLATHVCPWWAARSLTMPLRRLLHRPTALLAPFVAEGMTVIEPGPGAGYFTLELARLVGPAGRVVALDVQPKMLEGLRRRAEQAGLADRIDTRLVDPAAELPLADLEGRAGFALLFWMVHEVQQPRPFLAAIWRTLRPGGQALLAEPWVHVSRAEYQRTLALAGEVGLEATGALPVALSRAAVLRWRALAPDAGRPR